MTREERHQANEAVLARYEGVTAIPMLVLAIASLPLLVVPVILDLAPVVGALVLTLDWLIWGAFAVDYLIRLRLARYRGTFVQRNVFDLLIVVLPFLRPLRVFRSARGLRLLRAGRAVGFMGRGAQSARLILTRHKLHYLLLVAAAAVLLGAALVWQFERGLPHSNIHSYADAVWWAVVTLATVGYGDLAPVSEAGRFVAVALMILGIGVVAMVAASFASFFVGKGSEKQVEPKIDEALHRLERIERALAALQAQASSRDRQWVSAPHRGDD